MSTYMSLKEIAAELRGKLKTEFPNYKFSVTFKDYRSLYVTLLSGPTEVFHPLDDCTMKCIDVNHYHRSEFDKNRYMNEFKMRFGQTFEGSSKPGLLLGSSVITEEAWDMMWDKVCTLALEHHWDKSDIQSDYFNCNYYLHVAVGKWDKPYQVVPANGCK